MGGMIKSLPFTLGSASKGEPPWLPTQSEQQAGNANYCSIALSGISLWKYRTFFFFLLLSNAKVKVHHSVFPLPFPETPFQ